MTRILVVDDHPIFRKGLALALSEAADLTVCGEGDSGEDALRLVQDLQPDLLLLDLSMPMGGLDILPRLCRAHPGLKVAVLTASEDSDDVLAALDAGALGYIVKGIGSRALIEAVRALARGEGYVTPALAARLLSERRTTVAPASTLDDARASAPGSGRDDARARLLAQLTPRERQVLALVAAGHSNKEIALREEMQEKTVKHHMTRILQKLHARNRTEAAMILRGDRIGL